MGMKSQPILIKLANALSWSQNENDAANTQLLPMIIQGAGHGTMSVKVRFRFQSRISTLVRRSHLNLFKLGENKKQKID